MEYRGPEGAGGHPTPCLPLLGAKLKFGSTFCALTLSASLSLSLVVFPLLEPPPLPLLPPWIRYAVAVKFICRCAVRDERPPARISRTPPSARRKGRRSPSRSIAFVSVFPHVRVARSGRSTRSTDARSPPRAGTRFNWHRGGRGRVILLRPSRPGLCRFHLSPASLFRVTTL